MSSSYKLPDGPLDKAQLREDYRKAIERWHKERERVLRMKPAYRSQARSSIEFCEREIAIFTRAIIELGPD